MNATLRGVLRFFLIQEERMPLMLEAAVVICHPCALPFAWMDLENILLSEISQSEKDRCHMIPFMCGI